jgi:hypothetical protein
VDRIARIQARAQQVALAVGSETLPPLNGSVILSSHDRGDVDREGRTEARIFALLDKGLHAAQGPRRRSRLASDTLGGSSRATERGAPPALSIATVGAGRPVPCLTLSERALFNALGSLTRGPTTTALADSSPSTTPPKSASRRSAERAWRRGSPRPASGARAPVPPTGASILPAPHSRGPAARCEELNVAQPPERPALGADRVTLSRN